MRGIKAFIISSAIIMVSCTSKNNQVELDNIKLFDASYGKVILDLCDSLYNQKDLNFNYILEFRPRKNQTYFRYVDTLTNAYFSTDFELTSKQKEVFQKIKLTEIRYVNQHIIYYMRPFYFKANDSTVSVIVNYRQENYPIRNKLFENGRLIYFKEKAWN